MTARAEQFGGKVAGIATTNGHVGRVPAILEAVRGDVSTIRRTRWAWQNWAPLGSFLLIAGEGAVGKGILTSYVVANLTRGTLPGDLRGEPVNVGWVGFEDSWDEQVLPRVVAAGGEADRFFRVRVQGADQYLDIVRDQSALADLVKRHDLRALCFEAIPDHITGDDHKNAEVRRALAPLVELARARELLAVGTTHLNKMTSGTFRQRVAASGGYLAVARVGWLVHRHPDDEDLRVLALGKGNLGETPDPMVFSIEGTLVANPTNDEVADVGRVVDPYFEAITVDEILAGSAPDHGSREDDVVAFLGAFLKDGRKSATAVFKAAAKAGLAKGTVKRHKEAAGAVSDREGGEWFWRLDEGDE